MTAWQRRRATAIAPSRRAETGFCDSGRVIRTVSYFHRCGGRRTHATVLLRGPILILIRTLAEIFNVLGAIRRRRTRRQGDEGEWAAASIFSSSKMSR